MSHDAKYMAERVAEKLVGCTIVSPIRTMDGMDFGFSVFNPNDGKRYDVWVQSDSEGNDSGWLAIEPVPTELIDKEDRP